MPTGLYPTMAGALQNRSIQVKSNDRCPTGWRCADDKHAVLTPAKVLLPVLGSRIENRCGLACVGIVGAGEGAFEFIAGATGKPQIFAGG